MANTDEQRKPPDGTYAVDIRVFLACITLAMAASFIVGVGLGPASTVIEDIPKAEVVKDSYSELTKEEIKKIAEEHRPSGQHLLVDIEGVEEAFLNSEERLSKAMVDTVQEAGLTMLSYHCHSLIPSGVSCVGVLLESHISFHTWPSEGVITLDLFTCGSKPLLPAVKTLERLFGIGESPRTQWSHELRGFRNEEEKKGHYLDDSSDLSLWVLSPLEMYSKDQIYSNLTKFQRVDIWDIREVTDTPTYEDVLKYNMSPGDPRLFTPEYATPDRLLFLDGTVQSTRMSEMIYHEAMVHPGMFAHPDPRNVAIVGGGEGATLREVLKHKRLESATMIEIDEELIQIAREHLPAMSDCSDLLDRADNCFDDKLVDLQHADARKWFIDRYGPNAKSKASQKKFDVILVDALDPEDDSKLSDQLYGDAAFIEALVNSLSDEGVIAIQVGTAATIDDPRPDIGVYKNRERLFNLFENNDDVDIMMVYEDPNCGFLEPHSFLTVCKSANCRSRWYARSDQVDYEIYDRIVRTESKKRALKYFDGTTQRSYQWPKKGWETVYCRREPTPFECAYRHLPSKATLHEYVIDDEDQSSFRVEVTKDDDGNTVSSKVFATDDIQAGDFIMAEHLASSLLVTSRNLERLDENVEVGGGKVKVIEDLLTFFDEYTHNSKQEGSGEHYVEVGASCLIRRSDNDDEVNVVRWIPDHPSGKRPKYSPVYERHRMSFDVFMVAEEDIDEGEEIVMPTNMW